MKGFFGLKVTWRSLHITSPVDKNPQDVQVAIIHEGFIKTINMDRAGLRVSMLVVR